MFKIKKKTIRKTKNVFIIKRNVLGQSFTSVFSRNEKNNNNYI